MNNPYIAKPPLPLWRGRRLALYVFSLIMSVFTLFAQVFIPYQKQPQPPRELPEDASSPDDAQLEQCQAIFDEVEARRSHLEQKAQGMFSLILFMAPVIGSIFVFIFKEKIPEGMNRTIALYLLFFSGSLLVMSFISVMRAISIKAKETLFISAVIDEETGNFRKYDKAWHAQGLIYCASMNTAINDHIAQFVKGAQFFTGLAALTLLSAAIPAGFAFSDHLPLHSKTEIVGTVNISSTPTEVHLSAPIMFAEKQLLELRNILIQPFMQCGYYKDACGNKEHLFEMDERVKKIEVKLDSALKKIGALKKAEETSSKSALGKCK